MTSFQVQISHQHPEPWKCLYRPSAFLQFLHLRLITVIICLKFSVLLVVSYSQFEYGDAHSHRKRPWPWTEELHHRFWAEAETVFSMTLLLLEEKIYANEKLKVEEPRQHACIHTMYVEFQWIRKKMPVWYNQLIFLGWLYITKAKNWDVHFQRNQFNLRRLKTWIQLQFQRTHRSRFYLILVPCVNTS